MKESDIRDNNLFQRYQNLVDIDARKFFYNKNNFKNINYKSWGCKEVRKIFVKKKNSPIFNVLIPKQYLLIQGQNLSY